MARRKRKAYEESTTVIFDEEELLEHVETTTVVDTISSDGRRTVRCEHTIYTPIVPAPRPTTRPRHDPLDSAPWNPSCFVEGEEDTIQIQPPNAGKRKAKNLYFLSTVCQDLTPVLLVSSNLFQEQDSYLNEWTREKDFFLKEMAWLDRLRDRAAACKRCGGGSSGIEGVTRCKDCFGGRLHCPKCCVVVHEGNPFHNIEVRCA